MMSEWRRFRKWRDVVVEMETLVKDPACLTTLPWRATVSEEGKGFLKTFIDVYHPDHATKSEPWAWVLLALPLNGGDEMPLPEMPYLGRNPFQSGDTIQTPQYSFAPPVNARYCP